MPRHRPVGLLVVRVWHDGEQFRARTTLTSDLVNHGPDPTLIVSTDPEHLQSLFLDWLNGMLQEQPEP